MKKIYKKAFMVTAISVFLTGNAMATTPVPKISGNYVFSAIKVCQSELLAIPPGSSDSGALGTVKSGDISTMLFQVKFTPNSKNYAGTAVVNSGYNNVGHELITSPTSTDIISQQVVSNVSLTYSNTKTTMWLSAPMNNNLGETFQVYYLNVDSSNIAHNVEFISLTDDHQSPTYDGGDPNKCTTHGHLSLGVTVF
jgi:hypothetical protein